MTAHEAAEKLIESGYERVTRLRDGTWEIQPPCCLAVFWRTDAELIAEAEGLG